MQQVDYLVSQKDDTLSRTSVNMVKVLMNRELAMSYSITGLDKNRQKTKKVFKGTRACFVIESECIT